MYGYVGYRRTFRVREFYAILAFLVGISIGFILTTRTRIQVITPDVDGQLDDAAKVCGRSGFQRVRQVRNSNADYEDVVKVGEGDKRKLIFIGVMTAQKYLETRAMAVHRTWAKHLDGRVVFFAGADAEVPPGLPVVRLAGVDDTYPPQKKSFLMLKYIYEHFGDDYEWFMRADDDVYIRGDRLETFLRSINSSQPQFIGQAGMGNKEEFGQLNLERDENFCMGGPGIVLSRETLRRVAPNVRHCLKNLYSTHEDVEVGRCVRRFAEIPCTWSYEMQSIFYHNNSGDEAFTGVLKQKEVHRAITLHPIKQHTQLYRLHKYIQSLAVHDMLQKTLMHYREMHAMISMFRMSRNATSINSAIFSFEKDDELTMANVFGKSLSLTKFFPSSNKEVVKWDFIQHTIYSHMHSNPRRKLETWLKESINDVNIQIMDKINKFSKQRGRIIDFKELLYGYYRFDQQHGVDYILDMLLVYKKYRGRKMTIPVRKHVYAQQAFTEVDIREVLPLSMPTSSSSSSAAASAAQPSETVNFVLPLSGRFYVFLRFMKNFEAVCLVTKERVSLTVILFSDNSTDLSVTEKVVKLVTMFQKLYANSGIYVDVMDEPFSRAKALQKGAAHYPEQSLLFFVDVDMYFTQECLKRIRLNTIRGKQAYFPIVFSQYDPIFHSAGADIARNLSIINNELGYWRQYGFGIVSIYHDDLNRTGGLDVTIRGWGKEDVDLYDKVVASNLTIFRAPDLGLVHIFHPMVCDPSLPSSQLQMCLGSRAGNFASVHKLTKIFDADPKILQFSASKRQMLS